MKMKSSFTFLWVLLSFTALYAQYNTVPAGENSANAVALCNLDSTYYTLSTNNTPEYAPDYGCLYSYPNPSWFFIKSTDNVDEPIYAYVQSPTDLDIIIWGPFPDTTSNYSDLTADNIVFCEYSSMSYIYFEIDPVTPDSYYMLMMSNYVNEAHDIYISLASGSIECPDIITQTKLPAKKLFNIYPNPAQDFIYIESPITQNGTLEILDLSGKLILQHTISPSNKSITLNGLEQGVYLIRMGEHLQKLLLE